MKYLLTAMIIAFILPINAQVTLNKVTLPATMSVGQADLTLNGGGIRKKLIFKLYTAGLYVPTKTKDGNAVINSKEASAIRLAITSSMINSDNMSEAILEGFEKSTNNNLAPIQAKIDELLNTFTKESIDVGNVFDITYVPGEGVKTYKDGNLKSTIEGEAFKKALFGIWLSDNPVDANLKKGLLNL